MKITKNQTYIICLIMLVLVQSIPAIPQNVKDQLYPWIAVCLIHINLEDKPVQIPNQTKEVKNETVQPS